MSSGGGVNYDINQCTNDISIHYKIGNYTKEYIVNNTTPLNNNYNNNVPFRIPSTTIPVSTTTTITNHHIRIYDNDTESYHNNNNNNVYNKNDPNNDDNNSTQKIINTRRRRRNKKIRQKRKLQGATNSSTNTSTTTTSTNNYTTWPIQECDICRIIDYLIIYNWTLSIQGDSISRQTFNGFECEIRRRDIYNVSLLTKPINDRPHDYGWRWGIREVTTLTISHKKPLQQHHVAKKNFMQYIVHHLIMLVLIMKLYIIQILLYLIMDYIGNKMNQMNMYKQ